MPELLEIINQLEDTEAAIAQTEQQLALHPNERGLRITLASLEKRQENLSVQFDGVATARGLDVCSYRLFSSTSSERPNLRTFASTLRDFQELVTTVYDALHNGPKARNRVGIDSVAKTSFGFGYAFTGSLGVVLTLPNDRMLIPTEIDDAITTVFSLVRSEGSADVAAFVKRLGTAPIRLAYEWAADHADAGVGADIEWRRADDLRASLVLQPQELSRLQEVIEQTSDVKDDTYTWIGVLLAADSVTGAFRMSFSGAADVKGKMTNDIDPMGLIIGKRYRATIRKQTVTKLATGQTDETNELLNIEPLDIEPPSADVADA